MRTPSPSLSSLNTDAGCSHSTGRGGRANITALNSPPLEPSSPHPNEYETTGRGGRGNMVRSRSASREPRSRSGSRVRDSSGLARILGKVGLHSPRGEDDGAPHMRAVAEDGEAAPAHAHAHAPPVGVPE